MMSFTNQLHLAVIANDAITQTFHLRRCKHTCELDNVTQSGNPVIAHEHSHVCTHQLSQLVLKS